MRFEPFNSVYERWDGSQDRPELPGEEIFDEIRDSLLYHGDVASALKDLLSEGIEDRNGIRTAGIREIVERLAAKRREILSRHDPNGVLGEISEALDAVVEIERDAIESQMGSLASKDDLASSQARDELRSKQIELSALGGDPNSRLRFLKNYRFVSPEADALFKELVQGTSQQLLDAFFNSMKRGLSSHDEQSLKRSREMLSDLNDLLAKFRAGQETDVEFRRFMEKWGDDFPPGIDSVERLIEFLSSQMTAASAMFNSLDPAQRRELMELSQRLLDDMDLSWEMSRLSENLTSLTGGGAPRYGFHGDEPFGLGEAPGIFSELGEISDMETFLRQVHSPFDLARLDLDRLQQMLGKDARDALERLSRAAASLEEAGYLSVGDGHMELTPKAMRQIGESALREIFSTLDRTRIGDHSLTRSGVGTDLEYDTKPYEFGDPFSLNINKSIRNALVRNGGGTPVRVLPEDFEIERTEQVTRTSTALLLDLSLSMPLRDNFLTAKKVAVALHSLITGKYPKDSLSIIGFSEVARRIEPWQLPEVSWDYVYGTNMEHALLLARENLRYQQGRKQVIMITDGEPTAHILPGGEVFFSYPSTPETIAATMKEVMRCTREGIVINSFVLDSTRQLRSFMDRLTAINKGRVFYTDPDDLGHFVLVDYLANRSAAL